MSRRKARETALKTLFQMDQAGTALKPAIEYVVREFPLEESSREYAFRLAQGTWEKRDLLDRLIQQHAAGWRVSRMAAVDRNILRIAAFEILFVEDVPTEVAINEAVELAKRYGGADSPRFVNGILGSLAEVKAGEVDLGD